MALARFHLGQALLRSEDRAGASEQFSKCLGLWKNADPDLPRTIATHIFTPGLVCRLRKNTAVAEARRLAL
jgi:hypothetical protein